MPDFDLNPFKGNRFAEIFWKFPCPQRILMVTDGLDFGTGDFGLSEFVNIVRAAGHTVTTAHRFGDSDATITSAFVFDTASPAVTVSNYDQVWLFGVSSNSQALTANEQKTIAQFMEKGGGVFATGDHSTLGQGMGANLPRVRGMRNWDSIPMSNPGRLDTVLEPGADSVKQFEDQSDAIPQRIFPVFFSNGGPDNQASSWNVHPVLRHVSGAVDYLPDHPHESECLAPLPAPGSFAGVTEWPFLRAAQIAAVAISAGRFVGGKPPVYPRSFNAISVYDGDPANVGRIVCDATWHHYVNINLNGTGAGNDPTTGLPRKGLYDTAGNPTPEYKKIQTYFLNTVRWLAPKNRRTCWIFDQVAFVRFDREIFELQLPRPHPCPWDLLLEIGAIAEQALTRHWGPGAATDLVEGLLTAAKASPTLTKLLQAQQGLPTEQEKGEPSLLPLSELRRAVLGSVVNLFAHKLPADEAKLTRLLKNRPAALFQELISEGLRGAEPAIGEYLQRAVSHTAELVKAIRAGK